MATRLYGSTPGTFTVAEGVGSATAADTVELTVDLSSTIVHENGTTRTITQAEVIEAIEKILLKVTSDQWPPA